VGEVGDGGADGLSDEGEGELGGDWAGAVGRLRERLSL
jgi:hypothetical protein